MKCFSRSAQLRLKYILLINLKMPTIVGILTFISRINDRLWSCKSSISIYLGYFGIYEQFFYAQLSWAGSDQDRHKPGCTVTQHKARSFKLWI